MARIRKNNAPYQSLIGLLVLFSGLVGFGVFWWALTSTDIAKQPVPIQGMMLNAMPIAYSWNAPPLFAVIAALAVASVVVIAFVGLEIRDINISRRSHDKVFTKLSPWVLMDRTRGVFHGEVTITVIVPAHNEEDKIGDTLDSLRTQSRQPDRVIVLADNCTDKTIDIARARGVEVIESVNNINKKAGALNQVLAKLLPQKGHNDTIMVMDADTRLKQGFLASAVRHFEQDRGLSAIGGLFYGDETKGFLAQLQRNEYIRYSREIVRRRGKVFVLTGTASIFRAVALAEVAKQRGNLLPGTNGEVYDTHALTEDNEITIALKSMGALMMSTPECQVETELMPDPRSLWRQRLRWQRGALENIGAYGITSTTSRYWSQQLGLAYSVFALWSFFLLIFIQLAASDFWVWYPFWILLAVVFVAEKVWTVRRGDWRAKLLAATLIPELMYDSYLDLIFVKGIFDMALKRQAHWGHEKVDAKATRMANS